MLLLSTVIVAVAVPPVAIYILVPSNHRLVHAYCHPLKLSCLAAGHPEGVSIDGGGENPRLRAQLCWRSGRLYIAKGLFVLGAGWVGGAVRRCACVISQPCG